ncbi:MAG TPA: autotransporter-associated beta strand repeat-containing protein [Lacipirellulaceae bacterium]|nr:autotransporter-associated beta strand repeat-containing protein [Lacipirellulaceae bacterium]
MLNGYFSRTTLWGVLAIIATSLIAVRSASSQTTFVPTSGAADWNDDANWSPPPFPNATGAAATIPAATGDLTVSLNVPITVGSLDILKASTGTAVTTIDEGTSGSLTFDGGTATLTNSTAASGGTGATVITAPISFTAGMSVVQSDDNGLQLMNAISGTGDLNITRVGAGSSGSGVVALSGSNNYSGSTVLAGTDSSNFLVVRLNNTNAIPGGIGATGGTSNIVFTHSSVLGLRSDDFTRSIGTGPDQFQMPANAAANHAVQSGWAAFVEDRSVNIGGSGASVTWGSSGFSPNILVLGNAAADKTITFVNPLDLGSTGSQNIRASNGSAATDAIISGGITSSGAGLVFWGDPNSNNLGGTVRLTGASTYTGTTEIRDGVIVILDNANALGPGNLLFSNAKGNNILGLGIDNPTFTRSLGTGSGQVRIARQGGFAAYGGDRVVNLGGNAVPDTVIWGSGGFLDGNGGSLLLSADNSDGMIDFQNGIDLANAERSIAVRDGSAPIDATISGVITGTLTFSALKKNLAGTLALTNANTYGGDTTITDGTLLANNTSGSATGTGNVNVNAGTLGGTGAISGLVTVNAGGHITAGSPGSSDESLDVGSLTTEADSELDFALGAPGSPGVTSELLNVTVSDGLTINGGSVVLTDAGGLAAGTYTLIDYAGTLMGDVANLGTPTGPAGFAFSLMNNVAGTSVDLVVTASQFAGDYNNDGKVDAADYVLWRKDPAAHGGTPDGYNTWRTHFGESNLGSGSSLGSAAVPEPATLILLCLISPFFVSLIGSRGLRRTRS